MSDLTETMQSLAPGELIELFVLDLTPIGVAVTYYFTPTTAPDITVTFDGHEYTYAPVTMTGLEWNVNGDPPNPRVQVPNVTKFASALVVQHNDLVGAQVTRLRTYRQFLDGEDLADPTAVISRDLFTIEQKTALNRVYAEFALRPLYALDNKFLPKRICVKDMCGHLYRLASSDGTFDYTRATCPYTGSTYFKRDGTPTTDPTQDDCGLSLNDCALRFGEGGILPTRAFPGMTRLRM